MAQLEYGRLILKTLLVAVGTALIGSLISYLLGFLAALGTLAGIANALVLAGVFVYATKIRKGEESFVEAVPVIILSIALVEFLRTLVPQIPGILTSFTWTNLAVVLSSVFLSEAIVEEYVLR